MRQDKSEPTQIIRARFPIDGDMIDLLQPQPHFFQAVVDRAGRQPGPMLDPAKTFLFRRGHQFAVYKQARGGIAVVCVKAEDFHPK